jgi:acetyltransferase-like isoleucine patch superfamily enzyme
MAERASTYIDPTARIGFPLRPLQGFVWSEWDPPDRTPKFADPVYIGPHVTIGEAVILDDRVIIDEFCSVARGAHIGADTLVIYGAAIGGEARIGSDCVIGNIVSEAVVVGNRCKVFGRIIHKHEDSTISWDHHSEPEPSVTIEDDCFVGFDAIVAGGITIGPRSYVCAGAIVTKSVPPLHIAFGINECIHYTEWAGDLAKNPLFRAEP